MRESSMCAVHKGIQDYLFERLATADRETLDVLERWTRAGGLTIDGQLPTTHLSSLGFVAITREQFLHDLRAHADQHIAMSTARLPVSRLARS
jgi:Leu/Phe-tRNA-protein transferase